MTSPFSRRSLFGLASGAVLRLLSPLSPPDTPPEPPLARALGGRKFRYVYMGRLVARQQSGGVRTRYTFQFYPSQEARERLRHSSFPCARLTARRVVAVRRD